MNAAVPEPLLSLDREKLAVTIRFSKSSSPYFKEALRLAGELPGYRTIDQKMHEVKILKGLEEPDLWDRVSALVSLVGGWKRSEVILSGGPTENFWELSDSLTAVGECHARRGHSPAYCSGKEVPSDDPRAFGCRLARGVSCDLERYSAAGPKWYQFGTLSSELTSFTVDKEEILRTVQEETRGQAPTICPAFNW